LRGVRSLFPRIERQQQTTAAIAAFLQQHKAVSAVYYPGLRSHPGHETAKRQQSGFGAMLSFEIAGDVKTVPNFVETVSVFTVTKFLGGVESLFAHPATMTHAGMSPETRHMAGITTHCCGYRWGWRARPTCSAI
jgi:cystathionine gamma-synthase